MSSLVQSFVHSQCMTGFLIHHLKAVLLDVFTNIKLKKVCLTEIWLDCTDSSLLWKLFPLQLSFEGTYSNAGKYWNSIQCQCRGRNEMLLWNVMGLVAVCTEVTWLIYRLYCFLCLCSSLLWDLVVCSFSGMKSVSTMCSIWSKHKCKVLLRTDDEKTENLRTFYFFFPPLTLLHLYWAHFQLRN